MRILGALSAVALALAVASCGGSSSKSASTVASTQTAPSTTSSTTGVPATATQSATTNTTTTSTTTSGPGACRASGMSLSFIGQQGATGHGELGFALKNTGSQNCSTIGYPGVLFLDKNGAGLTTIPTHTTRDLAGDAPKRFLVVGPGQTVSFRLFVTHFTSSGGTNGCTAAAGLQVIPPNDTATLKVTIPGGAYYCQTVSVTPLQPGTSAYR